MRTSRAVSRDDAARRRRERRSSPSRPGSPVSRSRTRPAIPAKPLYPFDLAVERIRAARRAIDESGTGVLLTGRSEGFIVGRPDLDETIRRLEAYAEAGADCLYAPGIQTHEQISAVVAAVAPKPVNLLAYGPFVTVAEAADLGVRRISVGGALAKTAWGGFLAAAEEVARDGTFSRFADLPNVDAVFGR